MNVAAALLCILGAWTGGSVVEHPKCTCSNRPSSVHDVNGWFYEGQVGAWGVYFMPDHQGPALLRSVASNTIEIPAGVSSVSIVVRAQAYGAVPDGANAVLSVGHGDWPMLPLGNRYIACPYDMASQTILLAGASGVIFAGAVPVVGPDVIKVSLHTLNNGPANSELSWQVYIDVHVSY